MLTMVFKIFIFFIVVNSFCSTVNAHHYFTMNDIRLTVPTDRGKIFTALTNESLVQMRVEKDSHSTSDYYSIVDYNNAQFLAIDSISGNVFIADNYLPKTSNISTLVKFGKTAMTTLTLDFQDLDGIFDCDYIVEDLCFWKHVRYSINENAKVGVVLGTLSSPYLLSLCAPFTFAINYTIVNDTKQFRLIKQGNNNIVSLQTAQSFDREMESDEIGVNIMCTVENTQNAVRYSNRTFRVRIIDVDDNPAYAQEHDINITVTSGIIQKGQVFGHEHLIFHDKDNSSVNNYQPIILHDHLKILEPQCQQVVNNVTSNLPKTAIICKIKFNKTIHRSNWTYPIVLLLNDTTLADYSERKMGRLPINIHLTSATGQHVGKFTKRPEMLKRPSIYPQAQVKVFRTAAPFARITQPHKETNATMTFRTLTTGNKWESVFNVTFAGGIVYVQDTGKLKQAPEFIRLNISCRIDKKRIIDELEIHIIDEPRKTCENMTSKVKRWKACSSAATRQACLSSNLCAIATGGSSSVAKRERPNRCMWRGEHNQSNEVSHLYSTCTPDTDTCPDGVCDALEEMHERICPQDCTHNVLWPTSKNHVTNRGIAKASGVCTCDDLNCQCDLLPLDNDDFTTVLPPPPPPEIQHHFTNITKQPVEKSLGIDLAHCGTSCVLGIVAGSLFLAGALALVVICWRLDRVHKAVRGKYAQENGDMAAPLSDYLSHGGGGGGGVAGASDPLPLTFDMTTSLVDTTIINIINKYAPDPKWEFPRDQLTIEQTLGEGEFGRVLRAKALNIAGQAGLTTVAVKTLKEDAREAELNDLLSEYQLLKEVSHPNVIPLLGVCTASGGPIYLIIEFAEFGSLRNYLRRSRHLKSECGRLPASSVDDTEIHYDEPNVAKVTPKEILSFAWQICKGMAYLSEIKLVHRDLAARNVLLAADKLCKISDFGLTRDIYEDDAYFKRSKGRVPVKWMAPESLSDHVYTNKSDVWSFGILVWELVTLGATPYPGIAVQNIYHLLRQGYRMERPENCSATIYNIMRSCWHLEPEKRPTFQQLAAVWEKMLSDQVEYLDLTNNAIHNRSYFCMPSSFNDNNNSNLIEMSECGDNEDEDDGSGNDGEMVDNQENKLNSSLNYLSKSQSYVKCGTVDKLQNENQLLCYEIDNNIRNENSTQQAGYETPVKVSQVLKTPTNDFPQYYTDMAAGKTT